MNISVSKEEAKFLRKSLVYVNRLLVREYDAVYLRARGEAAAARKRNDLKRVKAVYRKFERDTGFTVREFAKFRKI